MPVFISSKSIARRHGVYAIERATPATIRATGTAQAAIAAQFPWGPNQALTTPTSMKNMIDMVAPGGMPRTGSGYLSIIRKGWPIPPKFVRVTGSSVAPVKAAVTLTAFLTVTLKYVGAAGNAVTATVTNASDGVGTHFNLSVSVTSSTGTTTDFFQNVNNTGTISTFDFTNTLLVGNITQAGSGRPANQSGTAFTGGSDGTFVAGDYVGTAGTADKGIALFEGDRTIDHLFSDDPGNSFRATVNAGLVAHADLQTDRIAYLNGPQGQSSATAITDVANYGSLRACYVDAWVYILDDTTGAKTLVPSAPFAASVAAQLPPSTSIAWKGTPVQTMLSGIVDLEFDRGDAAANGTDAGITTIMREVTGGFTFEAAVNTFNAAQPTKGTLNRTRMGHFIARSMVTSLRPFVDAPNVPQVQQDEINAVDTFLGNLKRAKDGDPINNVHILDYAIHDIKTSNAQADLDNGEFAIDSDVKISSAQSKIFLGLLFGETIKVNVTL